MHISLGLHSYSNARKYQPQQVHEIQHINKLEDPEPKQQQ